MIEIVYNWVELSNYLLLISQVINVGMANILVFQLKHNGHNILRDCEIIAMYLKTYKYFIITFIQKQIKTRFIQNTRLFLSFSLYLYSVAAIFTRAKYCELCVINVVRNVFITTFWAYLTYLKLFYSRWNV